MIVNVSEQEKTVACLRESAEEIEVTAANLLRRQVTAAGQISVASRPHKLSEVECTSAENEVPLNPLMAFSWDLFNLRRPDTTRRSRLRDRGSAPRWACHYA